MDSLPLKSLEVFLAIADQGSLRGAARVLGVQPPAVSYQLKALEERLGTSLFVRTTRSLQLTDAGAVLLERARPAVAALGDALDEARDAGGVAKGTLRLTLPYSAYHPALSKRLAAFHETYPEIELDMSINEAFVDLVEEGFHAGVRLGDLIHDDMIAVRLTPPVRQVFFASPAYLEANGRPDAPNDLLRHNCIRYRYIATNRFAEWQFKGPDGLTTVDVRGSLIVNGTNALIAAAREGVGIGWLFQPDVEDELRASLLESVLDDYAIERPGYFLYYPRANMNFGVLRAFIDFFRA